MLERANWNRKATDVKLSEARKAFLKAEEKREDRSRFYIGCSVLLLAILVGLIFYLDSTTVWVRCEVGVECHGTKCRCAKVAP